MSISQKDRNSTLIPRMRFARYAREFGLDVISKFPSILTDSFYLTD